MCKFFSFVTVGSKKYYFNWKFRQQLIKDNPMDYSHDSHSSICHFNGIDEDKCNKFEYNPLTGEFVADQINIKDNQALAKKWVTKLDFGTVVEPLVCKPIIHPFKVIPPTITDKQIELLKQWASVRGSVRGSIRDSVWAPVGDSVGDSVRASVMDLVGDSVGDSVGDLVWDSVWDSVWAYTSSFFNIPKWKYIEYEEGKNPFQSCIDLWEQGLVLSFDEEIWRLHGGENAQILFAISKENLLKL